MAGLERVYKLLQKKTPSAKELEDLLGNVPSSSIPSHIETKKGVGLLHLAIATDDIAIVETLLRVCPHLDMGRADAESGWPPLIYAIAIGSSKEIIHFLMRFPQALEVVDCENGYSPLHWASKHNDTETVSHCLTRGLDVNSESGISADTPLHVACAHRSEDAANVLIDAQADLNAVNANRDFPIHIAIREHMSNVVRKMLDCGTLNVHECVDGSGNTPLHIARLENMDTLARLLESRGFSTEDKNAAGLTAADITKSHLAQRQAEQERKACERQDREKKKQQEKEAHMNKTDVTNFCKQYHLDDLIPIFYGKKIFFDDQYFAELDELRLRKMGLTGDQRQRFAAAHTQRQQERDEAERQAAREALYQEMMRRRWLRLKGIGVLVLLFLLVFIFLKIVEYIRRPFRHAPYALHQEL